MISERAKEFLELFEGEVTLDTKIEDLNMDSLEFIELVQRISEKFGPVSDEKISRVCTVKELFDAVSS